MSGYIGNTPVPQATQSREAFTATASQTTFATVGYTVGFLDVFLNGVHLINGTDYTATNGSDVVLTTGAAAGDILEVISYSTYEVNNQNYTGDLTVDTDVLVVDSTNDRVGVNKASPAFPLDVTGAIATDTGIYLGGTGAANLLDDYEEGTWTPSVPTGALNVSSAKYVKVGSLVTITLDFSVTTGGANLITGLPFVNTTTVGFSPYTSDQDISTGQNSISWAITTTIYNRSIGDNTTFSATNFTTGATYHAVFSYHTH